MRVSNLDRLPEPEGEVDVVELQPMTPGEFEDYLDYAVKAYGESRVRSGHWKRGEAPELAEKTIRDLLPDGLATPGHELLAIRVPEVDRPVGYVWLGLSRREDSPRAYVYDLVILEEFRRRGYGKGALQALENKARALGARMIAAHVSDENFVARALYDHIGYTVDQVELTKLVE